MELGDLTVALIVAEPGWRWSATCVRRSAANGARRVTWESSSQDASALSFPTAPRSVFGPNDVVDIPRATTGSPSATSRAFRSTGRESARWPASTASTAAVLRTPSLPISRLDGDGERLGDARWRELLSEHFEGLASSSTVSTAER